MNKARQANNKMESFKEINEINAPDERNLFWCAYNKETGFSRPIQQEDIYFVVSSIKLKRSVPETIISQFNIAKNVALYSWYCYSFHQICEMKAYSTLEFALKEKLKKSAPFPKLIKSAINRGLIQDAYFSHIDSINEDDPTEYSRILAEIMPKLRNGLAHGGTTLHPGSLTTLRICAECINQLYRD